MALAAARSLGRQRAKPIGGEFLSFGASSACGENLRRQDAPGVFAGSADSRHRGAPTQSRNHAGRDSIFSAELFNRLLETDASFELCSPIVSSEILFSCQLFIEVGRGVASVICATHSQKRFAATAFAALLYCLCKGLG